jgi:hypothetical protein
MATSHRESYACPPPLGTHQRPSVVGRHRHPASAHTNATVCAGLPLASVLLARFGAVEGLITGIGFTGGGAIVKSGIHGRGTTTAASLWPPVRSGLPSAWVPMMSPASAACSRLQRLDSLVPLKRQETSSVE